MFKVNLSDPENMINEDIANSSPLYSEGYIPYFIRRRVDLNEGEKFEIVNDVSVEFEFSRLNTYGNRTLANRQHIHDLMEYMIKQGTIFSPIKDPDCILEGDYYKHANMAWEILKKYINTGLNKAYNGNYIKHYMFKEDLINFIKICFKLGNDSKLIAMMIKTITMFSKEEAEEYFGKDVLDRMIVFSTIGYSSDLDHDLLYKFHSIYPEIILDLAVKFNKSETNVIKIDMIENTDLIIPLAYKLMKNGYDVTDYMGKSRFTKEEFNDFCNKIDPNSKYMIIFQKYYQGSLDLSLPKDDLMLYYRLMKNPDIDYLIENIDEIIPIIEKRSSELTKPYNIIELKPYIQILNKNINEINDKLLSIDSITEFILDNLKDYILTDEQLDSFTCNIDSIMRNVNIYYNFEWIKRNYEKLFMKLPDNIFSTKYTRLLTRKEIEWVMSVLTEEQKKYIPFSIDNMLAYRDIFKPLIDNVNIDRYIAAYGINWVEKVHSINLTDMVNAGSFVNEQFIFRYLDIILLDDELRERTLLNKEVCSIIAKRLDNILSVNTFNNKIKCEVIYFLMKSGNLKDFDFTPYLKDSGWAGRAL